MHKVVGDVIEDRKHHQTCAADDGEKERAMCAKLVDVSPGLDKLIEREVEK